MINVKQSDALNAFYAIRPLMRQRMSKQKALELYNLRLILQKQFDFQVEQEQNIIQELGGTVDEHGTVQCGTKEKNLEFQRQKQELFDLELQLEANEVDLSQVDVEVAPEDIGTLKGFVKL